MHALEYETRTGNAADNLAKLNVAHHAPSAVTPSALTESERANAAFNSTGHSELSMEPGRCHQDSPFQHNVKGRGKAMQYT
eukprot:6181945-Pleurochrysis_carterae.AAC.3